MQKCVLVHEDNWMKVSSIVSVFKIIESSILGGLNGKLTVGKRNLSYSIVNSATKFLWFCRFVEIRQFYSTV